MTAFTQIDGLDSERSAPITVPTATDVPLGRKPLGRLQLAGFIFLGWTIVGLFKGLSEILMSVGKTPTLIDNLFDSWVWALLTPALVMLDRKFALKRIGGLRSVMLFLLLSAPTSIFHTYLTAVFLYPFPEVTWNPLRDTNYVIFYFLGGWATYVALIAILQALRFYNSYLTGQLQIERMARSLVESRLSALRLHLEPHFLFNTLNAISSEFAEDPPTARNMIGNLGALLRQSLDCKDAAEIRLAEELSILEHYLSIQRVRFGQRIRINVSADPEMLSAMVPSMMLQPLVENAIRHGIEGRLAGGTIAVLAAGDAAHLCIQVIDDGVGLPLGWRMETSTGHGLRVTRERLIALYPEMGETCFSIARRQSGGTEVVMRIPLRNITGNGLID